MYQIEILRDTVVPGGPALKGSTVEVDFQTARLLIATKKAKYLGDPDDLNPESVNTVTNADVAVAQESGEYVNQPLDWKERRLKARGKL